MKKTKKRGRVYTFELYDYEIEEFRDALEFASEMVKLYETWRVDAEWYDTVEYLSDIKQVLDCAEEVTE